MSFSHFLLAAVGGGLGAGLRYVVGAASLRWFGPGFPWGTLTVNVLGSLAMGVLIGWLVTRVGTSAHAPGGMGLSVTDLRVFLATGVLGGFTTFSAFALDVVTLHERGAGLSVAAYVLASVMLSVLAVLAGLALARELAT